MIIVAPISIGELYDKISVLKIKQNRISNQSKLINVNEELKLLNDEASKVAVGERKEELKVLTDELMDINTKIWENVDLLHVYEITNRICGDDFSATARAVYLDNDIRANIKRQINSMFSSSIVEEKHYSSDAI